MLKSELMELRKMYQDELDHRNELLKLLQTEEVKAYLKLSGEKTPSVKEIDIYKIIKEYLKKIKSNKLMIFIFVLMLYIIILNVVGARELQELLLILISTLKKLLIENTKILKMVQQ